MTWFRKNIYWETSAINYFCERFDWNDAIATKGLQLSNGNKYYLSPVTLWEILLTKDNQKREEILFKCQNLFYNRLLNSPSEFIINYINAGCPLVEKKYNFHSKLPLAQHWNNLCENKKLTFKYDVDQLIAQSTHLRDLSKRLWKIIYNIYFEIEPKEIEFKYQNVIRTCVTLLKDRNRQNDPASIKIYKISILLIIYFLCIGTDIDNTPIRNFWDKLKIESITDRIAFVLDNYEILVYRGPFAEMASMAAVQIEHNLKSNRGLIFDCLHTIYLCYIDIFITNDLHFTKLKKKHQHLIFQKIYHIKDLKITTQERNIIF